MDAKNIVYLVDDDPSILSSIAGFLRARGFLVQTFASPVDFLQTAGREIGGCLVTDVRMPSMSGLELVTRMGEMGCALPTIFMTAYADTELKMEVSKRDAIDVLEKPFKNNALIKAIRRALLQDGKKIDKLDAEILQSRFANLTALEKGLLGLLVQLKSNQTVARELGMSVRELEQRRATIMSKMQATTIADLISLSAGIPASGQSWPS
jgi:two-component system response regulator FixJ